MDKVPISLCMIVKNEETMLEDCLLSVADMVNEMIVVDTGSSDNTTEIARKMGAKVFFHKWNENFAEARNAALYHAKNPWILQLDADEKLEKKWHNWFYKTCPWPGKAGYLIAIDNLTKPSQEEVFTAHYAIRFFKNSRNIKYKNKIHEAVTLDWSKAAKSSARIIHKGYAVDKRKQKRKKRNLPLLKQELEQNPEDPFALANMALYYGSQNNYLKADKYANKALQFEVKGPLKRHCLRFCMYQALQNAHVGKLEKMAGLTNKNEFPEVLYFSGLMEADNENRGEAEKKLVHFLRCVNRLSDSEKKEKVAIDNICNARLELSKIYRKNNNLQKAERQLAAATNECPTRITIKLQWVDLLIHLGEMKKALVVSKQIRTQIENLSNYKLPNVLSDLEKLEHQIKQLQNSDS